MREGLRAGGAGQICLPWCGKMKKLRELLDELAPDDASDLIYAGAVAFRQGELDRAEGYLRRAIMCSEGCIDEAYFNLGGCLLSRKRYEEARECYAEALSIDPEDEKARAWLEDVERVIAARKGTEG